MEYIGISISLVALVLLILMMTKYKGNRSVRLALFLTLVASSVWRSLQNYLQGIPIGILDALVFTFFALAAASEIVGMLKKSK